DRVYASDIKKVIQWYNLLIKNGYTDFSKDDSEKTEAPEEAVSEEKKEEK
ncbi:MAG: hypothetical protein WCE57_08760, partial [Salegentibacter sp.]